MKKKLTQLWKDMNTAIRLLDRLPLWWIGLILLGVTFAPYFILREGSVFEIHDQLDETLLTYVLNARHLGNGDTLLPELLGGINASGMQPSAILFIPLYRVLPALTAFLVQYAVVFASGFFGMYLSVKRLTGSSILATAAAGCFCLLPVQPVYGLSVLGVPLLLYALLCLADRKHKAAAFGLIAFFGLTTHLVLIGYVVLGFWALYLLGALWKRKRNPLPWLGFVELVLVYIAVNYRLFAELLLGNSSYVSHREELVNQSVPFWNSVKQVFLESGQHAPSLHRYLLLPILVLLFYGAFHYRRATREEKRRFFLAAGGFCVLTVVALLYGFFRSSLVEDWKNGLSGFLRYFQMERFYWIYPAGWYLEFALAFSLWWKADGEKTAPTSAGGKLPWWRQPVCSLLLLVLTLLPTMQQIKLSSYFYQNVNQINNGSQITGYISWESYYAEELMQELEEAIGRDMTTYRVAHLGISPAPSLMHGFYTVDGYSNNYPLEYKHRFRRVIAEELAKKEETRLYFDQWGSRCYLYNSITGTYWMLAKNSGVVYENLEFDMEALRELGCEYLFSGAEIADPERMGLIPMGYYETDTSYWGIWLYGLTPAETGA